MAVCACLHRASDEGGGLCVCVRVRVSVSVSVLCVCVCVQDSEGLERRSW
jgi:hypothetical protein